MKAKTVKIVKSLNVELTEEEFKAHAVELAKMMSERDRIENQMQSMRSQFKAELDEATAKINRERTLVQTGREWRDIHCTVVYDYDKKRVVTSRTDTGEVIEDRVMRLDEMQVEMDFDDASAIAAAVDGDDPDEDEDTIDELPPLEPDQEPYELIFHSGKKSHCIKFRNEFDFYRSSNYETIDAVYNRVALRLRDKLDETLDAFRTRLQQQSPNILVALLDLLPEATAQEGEYFIAASRRLMHDQDKCFRSDVPAVV